LSTEDHRDAVAREFTRPGLRVFTAKQYTRQGMFDAVRESRRRNSYDPQVQFLGRLARGLADDLTDVVALPPADIATVLIAAGGAGGAIAEVNGLCGTPLAALLQYAADELDQQADGGDQT